MQSMPELDWLLPQDLSIPDYGNTFMDPASLATLPGLTSSMPPVASTSSLESKSKASGPARSAYASSCASCRLRKVKCIRPDPEQPCNGCAKKNIRCLAVDAPVSKKRNYKNRTGDRIEYAKQAFGEADISTQSNKSTPPEGSSPEELAQSLSPSSVSSRMDETQISACFCAALVDSYYSCNYFQQPCIDWSELRYRFNSVSYRLNELPESTQTLMAVIVATASRVAVHEGIIGPSQLNSMVVLPLRPDVDLSSYGEKRDTICRTLERQARQKIISSEMLFKPSPEAIAALYLQFTLQNVTMNSGGWEGRQFMAVAASHLRALHEREENNPQHSRLFSDHVNMTICVSDCMVSAHIGASLQLLVDNGFTSPTLILSTFVDDRTDDDVKLFLRWAVFKDMIPKNEFVDRLIAEPTWPNAGSITQSIWYIFVQTTRKLVSKVTGPLARTSALDTQAVLDFWSACDNLWAFTTYARPFLRANVHLGQPVGVASQHVEMTRCALLHGLMACDKALTKRATGAIVALEEQDVLHELRVTSKKRMTQGSIDLAGHLELLAASSSNITLAASVQILQMNFDQWSGLLAEAATTAEGGPANFDDAVKIRSLNAYITAYKALSYSWPQFKDSAPNLTTLRDQLNDKLLFSQLFSGETL